MTYCTFKCIDTFIEELNHCQKDHSEGIKQKVMMYYVILLIYNKTVYLCYLLELKVALVYSSAPFGFVG